MISLHFLYCAIRGATGFGTMGGDDDLTYWLKTQLSAFEENFNVADKDRSGSLQFPEVCEVLRKAGFKGTDDDIKAIFQFADSNKDSVISRSEYSVALKRVPRIDMKEIVLRRAFTKLDKDNSGFLTRDELSAAAASQEAGLNFPPAKLADLLIAISHDSDQRLDYEEFLANFSYDAEAEALKALFDKIDKDKSGLLSRTEVINSIKADEELSLRAPKLSDLVIKFCKDPGAQVNYEDFVKTVRDQGKTKA